MTVSVIFYLNIVFNMFDRSYFPCLLFLAVVAGLEQVHYSKERHLLSQDSQYDIFIAGEGLVSRKMKGKKIGESDFLIYVWILLNYLIRIPPFYIQPLGRREQRQRKG